MSVFHDEIEIEDFEYDEEEEMYSYPCPCGDQFQISKVSCTCSAECGRPESVNNFPNVLTARANRWRRGCNVPQLLAHRTRYLRCRKCFPSPRIPRIRERSPHSFRSAGHVQSRGGRRGRPERQAERFVAGEALGATSHRNITFNQSDSRQCVEIIIDLFM